MKTYRILLVEDEIDLAELIRINLEIEGYKVSIAAHGAIAIQKLKSESFDLVIMDIMMPSMDGITATQHIRLSNNDIPIMILSASNSSRDRINGLRSGADDYMSKPFELEELLLRVKAILRRTSKVSVTAATLSCGPITLNEEKHQVTFNQDLVDLSPTEFRLLAILLENKGRVLSKSVLLDDVWGITFESETSVVDTYISYLRKKLHRDGFEGIKTIRGVGFQILEPK